MIFDAHFRFLNRRNYIYRCETYIQQVRAINNNTTWFALVKAKLKLGFIFCFIIFDFKGIFNVKIMSLQKKTC